MDRLGIDMQTVVAAAINTLNGAPAALRAIGRPNVRLVIDAMHSSAPEGR